MAFWNKAIETKILVKGMHCEHCARSVTSALLGVPSVKKARVDLPTGFVIIHSTAPLMEKDLQAAVETAGFSYLGIANVKSPLKR